MTSIHTVVNGRPVSAVAPERKLLVHFLREDVGLTGTHVGCISGRCGCCTVVLDGQPVKSCMVLAVQVEGKRVLTVEGLAQTTPEGPIIQRAFRECDAVECGFCTSGMIMMIYATLSADKTGEPDEFKEVLAGNLCRCTGYRNILRAAEKARQMLSDETALMVREREMNGQKEEFSGNDIGAEEVC